MHHVHCINFHRLVCCGHDVFEKHMRILRHGNWEHVWGFELVDPLVDQRVAMKVATRAEKMVDSTEIREILKL